MRYRSTRGLSPEIGFMEAVATGLAPDGGLYLPERLPDLSAHLAGWAQLDYPQLCEAFFAHFATDIEPQVLSDCIARSYAGFAHPDIASLHYLADNLAVLELFHGPTLAFKDFALQLLGNLYAEQIARTGRELLVLGATSGDTGAAAIHGLLGKPGVQIVILYPRGGVSPLQERQMTCTGADNVHAVAIDGTFDDAQAIIKALFGDGALKARLNLSAVNSINLARILAQCVYYLWAWLRLREADREGVQFVVPTGNFGNILAGWLLGKMGVPLGGLQIACNQNDILYRLFTTGIYAPANVAPSHAPSMDIQVASNFERFLYYHEGEDPQRVRALLERMRTEGRVEFANFDADGFTAARADDALIRQRIAEVYERYGYTVDPHTACGFAALPDTGMRVVLATAHPAKFPDVIASCIGIRPVAPALEALKSKAVCRIESPAEEAAVRQILERVHQHQGVSEQ